MKTSNLRKLTEAAILIAMATVLSMIKFDLPFGGGVTVVSMLPIVLYAHRHGMKWGVFAAFVYSLLQLVLGLDNVSYASSAVAAVGIILFDYVVAYTVIGLASVFGSSRKGVFLGILFAFLLRTLCHVITGALIWGEWMPETFMGMPMTNPWIYSILYNGWYMLVEAVLTEIVAMAAYDTLKENFFTPVQ